MTTSAWNQYLTESAQRCERLAAKQSDPIMQRELRRMAAQHRAQVR